MNWAEHHTESERLAAQAQLAVRRGELERARELYMQAARFEADALSAVEPTKVRTLGITAVSTAALWYKAGNFEAAQALAHTWLGKQALPPFAVNQLREMLELTWSITSLNETGVQFTAMRCSCR